MSDFDSTPQFRKGLAIDDPIMVTLPFYRWFEFVNWYFQIPDHGFGAMLIVNAAQREYLDPKFVKAWEAHMQEERDKAEAQAQAQSTPMGFLGLLGMPPTLPLEEPPDPRARDPRFDEEEDQ
jgi:hypothetical protein